MAQYTNKFTIKLSPTNDPGNNFIYRKNQTVGFVNVLNDFILPVDNQGDYVLPSMYTYDNKEDADKFTVLL